MKRNKVLLLLAAIILAVTVMCVLTPSSTEVVEVVITATPDMESMVADSVSATLESREASQPKAEPTAVPTTEAVSAAALPPAIHLGPWAPSGIGEDFEATCNEEVCRVTHLQLWWPGGGTKWGTLEVHTAIPTGLSVTVLSGAGSGWEYQSVYPLSVIREKINADMSRRDKDTKFFGFIDIDELIELGLVEVRFDRREGELNLGIEPAYP